MEIKDFFLKLPRRFYDVGRETIMEIFLINRDLFCTQFIKYTFLLVDVKLGLANIGLGAILEI